MRRVLDSSSPDNAIVWKTVIHFKAHQRRGITWPAERLL